MRANKKFFILAMCLFSMFVGKAFSQGVCEKSSASLGAIDEKVYFNSDQILLSDGGIFLLLQDSDGALVKVLVPQVNHDGSGLFVLTEYVLPHLGDNEVMNCDTYKTWVCRICGRVNPQGITRCLNYENHPK